MQKLRRGGVDRLARLQSSRVDPGAELGPSGPKPHCFQAPAANSYQLVTASLPGPTSAPPGGDGHPPAPQSQHVDDYSR